MSEFGKAGEYLDLIQADVVLIEEILNGIVSAAWLSGVRLSDETAIAIRNQLTVINRQVGYRKAELQTRG